MQDKVQAEEIIQILADKIARLEVELAVKTTQLRQLTTGKLSENDKT